VAVAYTMQNPADHVDNDPKLEAPIPANAE
jgi:hypothetical protein